MNSTTVNQEGSSALRLPLWPSIPVKKLPCSGPMVVARPLCSSTCAARFARNAGKSGSMANQSNILVKACANFGVVLAQWFRILTINYLRPVCFRTCPSVLSISVFQSQRYVSASKKH